MHLRRLEDRRSVLDLPPALAWLDSVPPATAGDVTEQQVRSLGNVHLAVIGNGDYRESVRLVIGREFVEVRGTRLHGSFDLTELRGWLENPQAPFRVDEAEWRTEFGGIVLCLMDCTLCGHVPRETVDQLYHGTMAVS